MRHWYWCKVTRNDEEPDTNGERVSCILIAHELDVDLLNSDSKKGHYLVLLPEFPEEIELVEIEMGVGELTVSIL